MGFSLSFGSAEVHENCRFFFAVTVSHYSMLGPLAPCWSLAPIQYKKRLASEEGGFSLTAWASPPSKVPARRSSAPVAVSRHWYTEFYFVTLRGTFDTGSPMHIRTPRWRHSMIKILVNV